MIMTGPLDETFAISPILANIALHGLQRLFGAYSKDERYILPKYRRRYNKDSVISITVFENHLNVSFFSSLVFGHKAFLSQFSF